MGRAKGRLGRTVLPDHATDACSGTCADQSPFPTQQRIVTYEEKTEALNQDQQKAIATKPALEATVKELQELLVILKVRFRSLFCELSAISTDHSPVTHSQAEEADEDRRQTVLKARDEKRHGREIEVAVAAGKVCLVEFG